MKNVVKCCECGDFYLEALEKAREGLVDRSRQILKLRDEVERLTSRLAEHENERVKAWRVCHDMVNLQQQILDEVYEKILDYEKMLQTTTSLMTILEMTDSSSDSE
ncbi:hypothetical protein DSLPV1_223 [Dishui lake phycodnavirus 1]|uniref:hypothetical protein n=1 Tax=Dishui lake phycodnavirus 1 TaxID=2079134 RepID=UPI000CD6C57D|nr:hypothetical protein C5Y57_gp175 [Dishui lake phycodnavirus 1]AUT19194.1 hypothetical protein DSLPV1_223 [Dishui lake phycodnavirus 1]